MKVVAVAAAVTLGLLAHVAAAQPSMTPISEPETPPVRAPAAQPAQLHVDDELSPGTATALSVGGTVLSYAIVAYAASHDGHDGLAEAGTLGTFLAPSFGHWYSHKFFTRGMGIRALGVTAAFAGAVVAFSECPLFSDEGECHESAAGPALLILGLAAYVGGTADDLMTAGDAARTYNAEQRSVAIAPTMVRGGGGVAVVGTF